MLEPHPNSNIIERKYFPWYIIIMPTIFGLIGCDYRFQDGYDQGYAKGYTAGLQEASELAAKRCDERVDALANSCRSARYSSSVSTQVCGGDGVTLNGKHYPGGKTGCVRVYSDGRVERF